MSMIQQRRIGSTPAPEIRDKDARQSACKAVGRPAAPPAVGYLQRSVLFSVRATVISILIHRRTLVGFVLLIREDLIIKP